MTLKWTDLFGIIFKQVCCTRYQVYYSQSQADGRSHFQRVNWWSSASGGLYRHPLLPRAADVYQDFNGRTFFIPVLHVRLPLFSRNSSIDSSISYFYNNRPSVLACSLRTVHATCVNTKDIYGGMGCIIILWQNL